MIGPRAFAPIFLNLWLIPLIVFQVWVGDKYGPEYTITGFLDSCIRRFPLLLPVAVTLAAGWYIHQINRGQPVP